MCSSQVGSTRVFLAGRPANLAHVRVEVSNVPVSARLLRARLITSVEWAPVPPSHVGGSSIAFVVEARVLQSLRAEGDTALLHAEVEWDDGFMQAVGESQPAAGSLNVSAISRGVDVTKPAAGMPFWTAAVAVGAAAECGDLLSVEWRLCATPVGSTAAPGLLDVPDAVSMALMASVNRLADPDDDATLPPMSVPSSAALSVTVAFDDGSSRDLSLDSRVALSVSPSSCAQIEGSAPDVRIVAVLHGVAALCDSVIVSATIADYGLAGNVSIPVVLLRRLELRFTGFPDVPSNSAIDIVQLGRVACSSSAFHHASARVLAYLSDAPSRAVVVTAESMLVSSNPQVLLPAGARMQALGPGTARISAEFGSRSSATVELLVSEEVLAPIVHVGYAVPATAPSSTLGGEIGSVRRGVTSVRYSNGIEFADIGALSPWLATDELVRFGSDESSAISIDSAGSLTLHSNSPRAVSVNVSARCAPEFTATLPLWANLHPAPADVDFGREFGRQFQQEGLQLASAVRIRTPANERLVNFQITGKLDVTCLTTENAFYTAGDFSGVVETLNDPPDEFQLAANEKASQLSGTVGVGTVTLSVVDACVTLISGDIVELFTIDSSGAQQSYGGSEIVAGRGFASLSVGARLRRLRDVTSHPRRQRLGRGGPRVAETTCEGFV